MHKTFPPLLPDERFTIAIIGTGPAGMLAALSLANLQKEIILIGPEIVKDDYRTTALMMPSIKMLEDLGVWEEIKQKTAPLKRMCIIDATARLVRSPTVNFSAQEIEEEAFGYNIPNKILNEALNDKIIKNPYITLYRNKVIHYEQVEDEMNLKLDNNDIISAHLTIAADGKYSLAREAAGIAIEKWDYPQTALVLTFSHQKPHLCVSTELHTEEGPFTQVPLPGNNSSLVWVLNRQKAKELSQKNIEDLAQEIEKKMQSLLGAITITSPLQLWDLSGAKPDCYAKNNVVLIGEAAHVFPPIGAQGLNLTVRDITTLKHIIEQYKNAPLHDKRFDILKKYNELRKGDIWLRIKSVNTLNKALLSESLSYQILRSFGLSLLNKFSFLRRIFMSEGMKK